MYYYDKAFFSTSFKEIRFENPDLLSLRVSNIDQLVIILTVQVLAQLESGLHKVWKVFI